MIKLRIAILLVLVILTFSTSTKAFTLTPQNGNFTSGTTTDFVITASPPGANYDSVQLYISITGGTITALTLPTLASPPTGTCNVNGDTFISNNICVNLIFSNYLLQNDTIAGFRVTWGTPGSAQITKDSENAYVIYASQSKSADVGTAGNFTIVSVGTTINATTQPTITPTPINGTVTPTLTPTASALPPTGIIDDNKSILVGIIFVISGWVLYNYLKQKTAWHKF